MCCSTYLFGCYTNPVHPRKLPARRLTAGLSHIQAPALAFLLESLVYRIFARSTVKLSYIEADTTSTRRNLFVETLGFCHRAIGKKSTLAPYTARSPDYEKHHHH
jgi:hypothetical protein